MKNMLLIIFATVSLSVQSQSNWIKGNAVWNYEWFSPGFTGSLRVETVEDTIIQGHTCQKLKCDNHEIFTINQNGDQAHYITTSYAFIYFEQDTVWHLRNNQFSVLYDFTAMEGQTRFFATGMENQECNDSSYLIIDDVYGGALNGVNATFYQIRDSSTNSLQHGGLVNSHFGMMSADFDFSHSFFPVGAWCMSGPNEGRLYKLRCFEDDSLTYNPGNIDCEYYTYLKLDESKLNAISVFPNPSSGKIELLSDIPLKKIQVMSITGSLLKEIRTDLTLKEIDLSELPQGTYYLNIENSNGEHVIKPIQLSGR
jgi:hypothetical protein